MLTKAALKTLFTSKQNALFSAPAIGSAAETIQQSALDSLADAIATALLNAGITTSPWANITDYGALGSNNPSDAAVNDAAIVAAWAASNVAYVPNGTFYHSGITVPFGKKLMGGGSQSSVLRYSGTGAAITLDACQGSEVSGLKIITDNSAATVVGVAIKNTGGADSKWNRITDNMFIQFNASQRIAGQVGLLIQNVAGGAQYWNHIENNRFMLWDTCILMVGSTSPVDGANQNYLANNFCATFNTGLWISTNCNDNVVNGLFGSHSSVNVFTDTLLIIGDGTNISGGNQVFGLISDMGANGKGYTIAANAKFNVVFSTNESALEDVEAGAGGKGNFMFQMVKTVNTAHFGTARRANIPMLDIETQQLQAGGQFISRAQVQHNKQTTVADADYTVLATDFYIKYTSISATRVITLPSASSNPGLWLIIKDESGSASATVKIQGKAGTGGQSLEGTANPTAIDLIVTARGVVRLYSNGANWFIV